MRQGKQITTAKPGDEALDAQWQRRSLDGNS
jgi:hypothetical protein